MGGPLGRLQDGELRLGWQCAPWGGAGSEELSAVGPKVFHPGKWHGLASCALSGSAGGVEFALVWLLR